MKLVIGYMILFLQNQLEFLSLVFGTNKYFVLCIVTMYNVHYSHLLLVHAGADGTGCRCLDAVVTAHLLLVQASADGTGCRCLDTVVIAL